MTRAFEGYFVPIRLDAHAFERRFRGEHLDPFASRVLFRDGAPAGALLVARRGWTSRIAGMGVAPELRGQGLGQRLLREAIAEARERGDHALLLEVIAQNTPAVRLYEGHGFRTLRRLVGYRRQGGPPAAGEELTEIDPLAFARVVAREGEPDLPWMLSAETLASATLPARAFRLVDKAYALIADAAADPIGLTAIVVPRAVRRQGWGTRLLAALEARFPGRGWAVRAIAPEELAPELFFRLGWERPELHQLEMRLDLLS